MLTLENDSICIGVKPLGAELISLINKQNKLEYLWQAGPEWTKHAPVLFPIVGQLKENKYFYKDKEYSLPRHGFAREKNFSLIEHGPNRLVFRLKEDENTLAVYPFPFILEIEYTLKGNTLYVINVVENDGHDPLYFSIGAHPAFKVPLFEKEVYDDYFLQFDKNENVNRWPLSNGLIAANSLPFFEDENKLTLTKNLFNEDAIVVKGIQSKTVSIKSNKHAHGLTFHLNDSPYLGLWAAKGGDFICIEPWHGIADNVNSDQQIISKDGIRSLDPGDSFSYTYAIEIY